MRDGSGAGAGWPAPGLFIFVVSGVAAGGGCMMIPKI